MHLGATLPHQDTIAYPQVPESCTRKDAVSGLPEVVIHSRNVSFERLIIEKQCWESSCIERRRRSDDDSSFECIGLMCLSPDPFYSPESHRRPVTRGLMCATSLNLMYHATWKLKQIEKRKELSTGQILLHLENIPCQVGIPFQDAKHTLNQWSTCMGHVSRRTSQESLTPKGRSEGGPSYHF